MKIVYHKMSNEFQNKIVGFKNSIKKGITNLKWIYEYSIIN